MCCDALQVLPVAVEVDDFKRHIEHVQYDKAVVVLIADIFDYPGSVYRDIGSLIGASNPVMLVINKVDLIPAIDLKVLFCSPQIKK